MGNDIFGVNICYAGGGRNALIFKIGDLLPPAVYL